MNSGTLAALEGSFANASSSSRAPEDSERRVLDGTWPRRDTADVNTPRVLAVAIALLPLAGCDKAGSDGSGPPPKPDTSVVPDDANDANAPQPADQNPAAPEAKVEVPGPPAGHGGTDELKALEGLSEAKLVTRFGKPTHERTFKMADCCHEFEIELYNTYPPKKGHDEVQIHEWTWDYEGYRLTVWTHLAGADWVALDTIRYSNDVEF